MTLSIQTTGTGIEVCKDLAELRNFFGEWGGGVRAHADHVEYTRGSALEAIARATNYQGDHSHTNGLVEHVSRIANSNGAAIEYLRIVAKAAGFKFDPGHTIDPDALREHIEGMRAHVERGALTDSQAKAAENAIARIDDLIAENAKLKAACDDQLSEDTRKTIRAGCSRLAEALNDYATPIQELPGLAAVRIVELETQLEQARAGAVQLADEAMRQPSYVDNLLEESEQAIANYTQQLAAEQGAEQAEKLEREPKISPFTGMAVGDKKEIHAPNGKGVILERSVAAQPLGRDNDELESYWLLTARKRTIGEVNLCKNGRWRAIVNFYPSPDYATMEEAIAWVYARDKYTGGTSPADQNKQEKAAADAEAREQNEHAAANPLERAGDASDSGSLNENSNPIAGGSYDAACDQEQARIEAEERKASAGDVTPDEKWARDIEPGERRPAVPVNPSAPKVVQEAQRGIAQGLAADEALARAEAKLAGEQSAELTEEPQVNEPEAPAADTPKYLEPMPGAAGEPLLGESDEFTDLRTEARKAFLAHGLGYDQAQKLFGEYFRHRDTGAPLTNTREMTVAQARHFIDKLLPILHPVEGRQVAMF